MAWQDDKSWGTIDNTIEQGEFDKKEGEREEASGETKITIFSNKGFSLWTFIKGLFQKE